MDFRPNHTRYGTFGCIVRQEGGTCAPFDPCKGGIGKETHLVERWLILRREWQDLQVEWATQWLHCPSFSTTLKYGFYEVTKYTRRRPNKPKCMCKVSKSVFVLYAFCEKFILSTQSSNCVGTMVIALSEGCWNVKGGTRWFNKLKLAFLLYWICFALLVHDLEYRG